MNQGIKESRCDAGGLRISSTECAQLAAAEEGFGSSKKFLPKPGREFLEARKLAWGNSVVRALDNQGISVSRSRKI